jgi:hypothetical protein
MTAMIFYSAFLAPPPLGPGTDILIALRMRHAVLQLRAVVRKCTSEHRMNI